jgi:hypothetical protein
MSDYVRQRIAEIQAGVVEDARRSARPKRKPSPAQQDGYVYFVRIGASVKIGFATDVSGRMRNIQTASPDPIHLIKVVRGTREIERGFHQRFARYQMTGEWFALKGAVAMFLKDCTEQVVIPPPVERKNFFDALLEPK